MNSISRPQPSANSAPTYEPSIQHGARRGQSAVETMVTVGIAIAFILPMLILFLSTTGLRTQTLAQVQAQGLAQQMADAAGEVWYAGNGSHKEMLVDYPQGLQSIKLGGDMLQPQPCPPASLAGWPTSLTTQEKSDQLHVAGREIILRMDGGLAGPIDVVARAPGMVCNPTQVLPENLNYNFGRNGGGVPSGLVMLEFTNKGDYVSITRAYG